MKLDLAESDLCSGVCQLTSDVVSPRFVRTSHKQLEQWY